MRSEFIANGYYIIFELSSDKKHCEFIVDNGKNGKAAQKVRVKIDEDIMNNMAVSTGTMYEHMRRAKKKTMKESTK